MRFALLVAALLVIVVMRLFTGPDGFDVPADETLIANRVDRVLIAVVGGSALSVAGVLLQSLMRNPLAAPDLLGVSGGASVAVIAASYLAWSTTGALPGTMLQ
ncbi:MAG: iron chelate uptake ABC transporter family permease subunit, partial [Phycisphaerales bacterium]|nr:iron chelate uptake ABC transporter family permease subunit [Phycisphaerales bacterium]